MAIVSRIKRYISVALAASLACCMALMPLPASAQTSVECTVERAPRWAVPEGYNAHDYDKCAAFLEQTDDEGATNGSKLSTSYDPNDPTTWGSSWSGDYFAWTEVGGEKRLRSIDVSARYQVGRFDFSDCSSLVEIHASENYLNELNVSNCASLVKVNFDENSVSEPVLTSCGALTHLYISFNPLAGLDLSPCPALEFLTCYSSGLTELDVSCCPRLDYLSCHSNRLTELDLSHCPLLSDLKCFLNELGALDVSCCPLLEILECSFTGIDSLDLSCNPLLRELNCASNALDALDVSDCTELRMLDCRSNELSSLDVSANSALVSLFSSGNRLSVLDLSANPSLAFDSIAASGNGFIGYDFSRNYYGDSGSLFARPSDGASFEGFFGDSGNLISMGQWVNYEQAFVYSFEGMSSGNITAVFSGGSPAVPGDIDGNGSVTTADAVIALRISMGLIDGSGFNAENADMDQSGSVNISDAVLILRLAMGLS
ncbi:MAG: hypothetical protein IKI64_02525 [Clostridia bacterium]|nr:hypothetical protein [Clostridia bacterium]